MKYEDREIDGHDYDGIKEFDNPLPNWWLVTFFGTIIFAFVYYVHYELGGGPSLKAELSAAMNSFAASHASAPAATASNVTEDFLEKKAQDPKVIQVGAQLFKDKCSMCHGPELQGLVGPNLTDNYWKNGKGTRLDIYNVVVKGVPEKGMASWGLILKEDELYSVANFVFSKKGSNPPNPKAPEGDLVQ